MGKRNGNTKIGLASEVVRRAGMRKGNLENAYKSFSTVIKRIVTAGIRERAVTSPGRGQANATDSQILDCLERMRRKLWPEKIDSL
jgi:hypothetical protein